MFSSQVVIYILKLRVPLNVQKKQGDKARLASVRINVPRVCFSMHYHMFGQELGELKINVLHANGSEINIWSVSGNQGNAWKRIETSVESFNEFQVTTLSIFCYLIYVVIFLAFLLFRLLNILYVKYFI